MSVLVRLRDHQLHLRLWYTIARTLVLAISPTPHFPLLNETLPMSNPPFPPSHNTHPRLSVGAARLRRPLRRTITSSTAVAAVLKCHFRFPTQRHISLPKCPSFPEEVPD